MACSPVKLPVPRFAALAPRVPPRGRIGLFGLGLPTLLQAARPHAGARPSARRSFGRAKACIVLFMWGGPAPAGHLGPEARRPRAVRGEFQADRDDRARAQDLRTLAAAGPAGGISLAIIRSMTTTTSTT